MAAHGHSPTGFDLFAPVRVCGLPYLHIDPSVGVVNCIWLLLALVEVRYWDQTVDGLVGTLGLAHPVYVGELWGLHGHGSRRARCIILVFSHTFYRKRVRPGGNGDSSPNSSSMSNMTCFFLFVFSSAGVAGIISPCHVPGLMGSWLVDEDLPWSG